MLFWRALDFLCPPPRKLRDGSVQTYREWRSEHRDRPPSDVRGPIRALDITQETGAPLARG